MKHRVKLDSSKEVQERRAGSPARKIEPLPRGSDGRPRPSMRVLQLVALFCLLIMFIGARDESARFNDLGHRMMCVCGCNQILLECNHVGCAYSTRMRNELTAALDRGDNDDLVLQSFVQKYGTTVIAAPTNKGFNRVAWIVPYLALILGIGGLALIVRTWSGRGPRNGGGRGPTSRNPELDHFRDQARKETGDV